jgi:hypothetical protein
VEFGAVIPKGRNVIAYRFFAKLGSDNGGFNSQSCSTTGPMRCQNLNVGFADFRWFESSAGAGGGMVVQVKIVPDNPGTWRGRIEVDYQ